MRLITRKHDLLPCLKYLSQNYSLPPSPKDIKYIKTPKKTYGSQGEIQCHYLTSPYVQSIVITHHKNGTTPPAPVRPIDQKEIPQQKIKLQTVTNIANLTDRRCWMSLESSSLAKKISISKRVLRAKKSSISF